MIELQRPATLHAALRLLARHQADAHALAGGTAAMLPARRATLDGVLVSLAGVPELRGIERARDDGLRLGATSTHAAIASSPLVRAHCPALADAFARIANPRVRNQATLGGNLALADPAHDPPAILIALGARVRVARHDGEREVAVEDLAAGPFASTLRPDELIVDVTLPPSAGLRVAHRKLVVRAASFRDQASYPTVSCGAALRLDDGCAVDVRIGLSGVHSQPLRAHGSERLLTGELPTAAALEAAARAAADGLEPSDDERGGADYKRAMAVVQVRRTLADALADRTPAAPALPPGAVDA